MEHQNPNSPYGPALQAFMRGLRPDPILSISEWCEKNMRLSSSVSALPGRWSNDVFPYLTEIMNCLGPDSEYNDVVFMKASQVGGTQILLNWLAYIMDYSPGPTMVVQPTLELAKRLSKGRVQPMLHDCECLRTKVRSNRSRDSGNTVYQKDFEGGTLVFAGANSAAGLRSMPVEKLAMDEVDAYPENVDGEGDPIALAEARQRTFGRKRRRFILSSPTFTGRSKIEKAYLETSDRRKYHIQCGHCNHLQFLRFDQLKYIEKSGIITDAVYECESCSNSIHEHKKPTFLREATWIKANPAAAVAGFHINTLYSPLGFFSWRDIATDFLKTKKDPSKLVVFVNTILGETFKEKGEAPNWEVIYSRRENYKTGIVPARGVFLTAGVDVQKDRLECEIVAWAEGRENWSIDYRVLYGDTAGDEVWAQLDAVVGETFPKEGTEGHLPIRLMAVDSGFNTQRVYNWARRYPLNRVIATKGHDKALQIIGTPSKVESKDSRGIPIPSGFQVWTLGVSIAKFEFYSNLKLPRRENDEPCPNYCHFPEYGEEFFRQLTAEQIVKRIVKHQPRYLWEKIRERNESLDCRIMNRACAMLVGVDRFTAPQWENLRSQVIPVAIPIEKTQASQSNVTNKKKQESGFW